MSDTKNNYNIILQLSELKKNMHSAVDLQNALENLGAEILNSLNSKKNMFKQRLPLNFIPKKFKELLAEKCWERLLFNTVVTVYMSFFFWRIYGNFSQTTVEAWYSHLLMSTILTLTVSAGISYLFTNSEKKPYSFCEKCKYLWLHNTDF